MMTDPACWLHAAAAADGQGHGRALLTLTESVGSSTSRTVDAAQMHQGSDGSGQSDRCLSR